jgi:alcohol dehydrogenase class IV
MQPFEFYGISKILFGPGTISRIGELAAALGRRALLIHNGPQIDRAIQSLQTAGVAITLHRQRGEPVVAHVDAALQLARQHDCDCVIGIGGGSAIDLAKSVAALLTNPGSPLDFMEVVGNGRKLIHPSAPWMAIPTTAGTGAEATRNAVIGLPEKKIKASIRSELLLARIALIDPELGRSVPPHITASSGMDALCQLIESFTSTAANPMTDALALHGLHVAARCLPQAFQNGNDLTARQGMALAALISGITLTSSGLGAVHGLAAPLGANFPAPHGTICAALLPHIIAANVHTLRQHPQPGSRRLDRFTTLARQLPGYESPTPDALIHFTAALVHDLQIPPLKTFGLTPKDIPPMISLSRQTSSMRFNPVPLSDDSLTTALTAAINGIW